MRIVDLNTYLDFRKALDKRITIFYSSLTGIVTFILFLSVGFFQGILIGIISFVIIFVMVYGIRIMVNNNVERKRGKVELNGSILDVTYNGEFGLLEVTDHSFKYIPLQKFGLNKVPEIEIDEDLFIGIGRYNFGKFQKLKYGEDVRCQMTVKSMPHGVLYQFDFYDVSGALEKMTEILDKVSRFDIEKHQ